MVPESFSKSLPWAELLSHLGFPPDVAALPADIPCPLCQKRMRVDRDPLLQGQWFSCYSCEFAGTGLALAARVWKTLPICAGVRLARELPQRFTGPDSNQDRIDICVAQHESRHSMAIKLIGCESREIPSGNAATLLRQTFGVPSGDSVPGLRGISRENLVRAVGRRELGAKASFGRHRSCAPDAYNGFRVGDWKDMLCLPYEDLPGRVRSILLVGNEGKWPCDYSFRQLLRRPSAHRHDENGTSLSEAGLWGLSAVLAEPNHSEYGDTVFAFDRPDLALACQVDVLRHRSRPAPIVCSWDGVRHKTRSSWDLLRGRHIVHIRGRIDEDLVSLLKETDASFFTENALGDAALTTLSHACVFAVGWKEIATSYLSRQPAESGESLLRRLALTEADESDLRASARYSSRCPRPSSAVKAARSIDAGKGLIVEEIDGLWRAKKTGVVLTDAPIRIARVVHREADGSIEYRGSIEYKGSSYPFRVPSTDRYFMTRPLSWTREFLVRQAGVLVRGSCRRNFDLIAIAMAFREPAVIKVPAKVGWDPDRGGIVFPTFRILPDGSCEPLPVPMTEFEPGLPYSKLSPDAAGRGVESVPALHAAILASEMAILLAPAFRAVTGKPSLVGGAASAAFAAVAMALGYIATNPPIGGRAAAGLGLLEGRSVINAGDGSAPPVDAEDLRTAFVEYLAGLLTRKLSLPSGGTLASRIEDDMANRGYFGPDSSDIVAYWSEPGCRAGALSYTLRFAIMKGLARIDGDVSLQSHGPDSLLVLPGGDIHVPLSVIRKAVVTDECVGVSDNFRDVLIEAGVADPTPATCGREPGYVIPGPWFEANVSSIPR